MELQYDLELSKAGKQLHNEALPGESRRVGGCQIRHVRVVAGHVGGGVKDDGSPCLEAQFAQQTLSAGLARRGGTEREPLNSRRACHDWYRHSRKATLNIVAHSLAPHESAVGGRQVGVLV